MLGRRLPTTDRSDLDAALEVGLRLLEGSAQTEVGVRRRLEARGYDAATARAAAAECLRRGLIDDASVAGTVTERRLARGFGRAAIAGDLRARGVAEQPMDDALRQIGMDDERAGARRIADRLWARELGRLRADDGRRLDRVAAALHRRGFEREVIRAELQRLASVAAD